MPPAGGIFKIWRILMGKYSGRSIYRIPVTARKEEKEALGCSVQYNF
jgi:hypothetical protein